MEASFARHCAACLLGFGPGFVEGHQPLGRASHSLLDARVVCHESSLAKAFGIGLLGLGATRTVVLILPLRVVHWGLTLTIREKSVDMKNRGIDSSDVARPDSRRSTSTSLVQRLKGSDEEAWQRLFDLYVPLVYSWCRRSGMQSQDAADVVQEVFRAVPGGIASFRHDLRASWQDRVTLRRST